ncbi:cell division protein FtsH, partial [Candidatus Peregrinibacteria bacterium CG10_big_fil_rev_8_21_14_0_10_54_7]
YGMGDEDLGIVAYGEKQGTMFLGVDPAITRNYSEQMARHIDEFVRETIQGQYKRAKDMVAKHQKKLDELAAVLLKKETMSLEEFLEIFEGESGKEKKA